MIPQDFTLLDFHRKYHRSGKSETYARDVEIQLRHFSRYLAEDGTAPPRLSDLSALNIQAAMNRRLDAGRTNDTANKLRAALLALWRLARKDSRLHQWVKPVEDVDRLRSPKHVATAWHLHEFEKILEAAAGMSGDVGPFTFAQWFQAVLRVVYNSGLRIGAAMATAWHWLDLDAALLTVPADAQKDKEAQIVKLLPRTVDALDSLRATTCETVFGDWTHDPNPRQWQTLTRRLRFAIVAAGLRQPGKVGPRDLWHKIRRSFATHIFAESGSIERVRDFLGHSSIDVTYRYIDRSKVADKLQADYLTDPAPPPLRLHQTG